MKGYRRRSELHESVSIPEQTVFLGSGQAFAGFRVIMESSNHAVQHLIPNFFSSPFTSSI